MIRSTQLFCARKSMTSLIDIEKYKSPFADYPEDLKTFAAENKLQLPAISSLRGQGLALLAQPGVRGQRYVTRIEADQFFKNIGMESKDSIQGFNKATGLKNKKVKRGEYCLEFPFTCDTVDIEKRKGAVISGDRHSQIDSIKNWWKKNVIDIPYEEWQVGHLDPTKPDASEENLAFQPPIQAKYRNRFKWDSLFHKMWPTASELIPKFDTYYTEDEQKKIFAALKKKFD
jgi:hypothetical protein